VANPNPNKFLYWRQNGTVSIPGILGAAKSTNSELYWRGNGTVMFPVIIGLSAPSSGFFFFL
jgi:hypothetical protein